MAIAFAGDSIDGHPPTTRVNPSPAYRAGIILGFARSLTSILLALVAVVVGAAAWAQARPGLLVDVTCFAAIAAGVFLLVGTGAGLITAGIAGLIIKDFGGAAPPGS